MRTPVPLTMNLPELDAATPAPGDAPAAAPRDFTAHHPIRVFEVDAFGELSTAGLLRYLQQTAGDAMDAIGFDLGWHERAGTVWLIRRTCLDVEAPARHGDALAIRTWSVGVSRVKAERAYEVRRGDGTTIARATTEWVYCDRVRGLPTRLPAALQHALIPGDAEALLPRVPAWSHPPAHAFRTQRRIELSDLDSMAHVNNARYAAFLEQDVFDALAAHGWTIDPAAPHDRLRLRRLDLQYLTPALYGDALEGLVWAMAGREARMQCTHALHRGGATAVRAHTAWEWTDGPAAALAAAVRRFSGDRS